METTKNFPLSIKEKREFLFDLILTTLVFFELFLVVSLFLLNHMPEISETIRLIFANFISLGFAIICTVFFNEEDGDIKIRLFPTETRWG